MFRRKSPEELKTTALPVILGEFTKKAEYGILQYDLKVDPSEFFNTQPRPMTKTNL